MKSLNFQTLWPAVAMALLFLTAVFFRPVMPIDETRYMTAAWEMWLRHDWLAPLTINFSPYHHKPPMLFWMINASWSIFGVSRWAGLLPITLAATACIYLTQALARKLFKSEGLRFESLPLLMIGSIPFLIYSTLIMFDITLTMFVLASLLLVVSFAEHKKPLYIVALALILGLGVLTKGPVMWLYIIFPVLLAPYWVSNKQNWLAWYGGCASAFILSLIPVAMWIIPVLKASNPDFAFYLLWEQTAGRITGKMGNTHHRPIYFYMPLIPVLFLPWAFFPSFWKGLKTIKANLKTNTGLRFIACWIIPVVIAFSLIGGKQPHYLVPLLPGVLTLIAYSMKMDLKRVTKISILMVTIIVIGQAIASQNFFKKYDLKPITEYILKHEDNDWAYVRKYQGELTFIGRLVKPMDDVDHYQIREWFKEHPDGVAVIRYTEEKEIADFEEITTMPYRGRNIGVFKEKKL